MFEILGDCIHATNPPLESHLRRIQRKKGALQSITLYSSIASEWGAVADVLLDVGISSLEVHEDGGSKDYSWLDSFAFVKELCLYSHSLNDLSFLNKYSALQALCLGDEGSERSLDLELLRDVRPCLNELTLCGLWSNLKSLEGREDLSVLTLSGTVLGKDEVVPRLNISELTLFNVKGLDLNALRSFPKLTSIELLSKIDTSYLIDLTGLSSLKTVQLTSKENFDSFQKVISESVLLELI